MALRCAIAALLERKRGKRGALEGRIRLQFQGSLQAPRARRYVQAPSPRLPPLPRAAYELPAEMDPGFPTRAGGRRAPEVVRYTGRETRDHSFSDEAAGPFRGSPQAPHPSPPGGTVPVTHPSRGRDGPSVSEVRSAGINGACGFPLCATSGHLGPGRLRSACFFVRPPQRLGSPIPPRR